MKEEALRYFDRGWLPIPLKPASKLPALERWRHLQYPSQRPSRETVAGWWDSLPDANIAIITGKASGLVVVDFDGEVNDPDGFLDQHGLGHPTCLARTGRGGFHGYYAHPGGDIPNAARLAVLGGVGVDVRGDGGYVVAPPSVHPDTGAIYEWLRDGTPGPYPDQFRLLDRDRPRAETSLETFDAVLRHAGELDGLMRGVGEGQRNHAAAKVAGWWLKVTKGDVPATLQALRLWNRQNTPPLSDRELERTLQSIAAADLEHREAPQTRVSVLSGKAWADAIRDVPPRRGLNTPHFPVFHDAGGLVAGDLVIIAGRPGMGKSTASWAIASDVALDQGEKVLIFSTEMTMHDVARWMNTFRHGEQAQAKWNDTLDRIARSPIQMCDKGTLKVSDIIEAVQAHQPRLVIVDHIQRLHGDTRENRNQQLEMIASTLKGLAKDTPCTMLVLSQLNRMSARELRRPQLHDLRESGGLEQEADYVAFLWTSHDDLTAIDLPVKVWGAKNRHGANREHQATFRKRLHRFDFHDDTLRLQAAHHEVDQKTRQAAFDGEFGDLI